MTIFQIAADGLSAVPETTFSAEGLFERFDIQRLLRNNISVLGEELMVIAEEFGDWLDSSRRIDLLCLDHDANLVVVELKRSEDGGFMELQALRYAAMISAMTFDQLVETHGRYRNKGAPDLDGARTAILSFLGIEEIAEEQFGNDTRLVLAAADFSKELTTSVMWLNDRGLDIRCVRLKPYRMENGPVLLDVQQIIPLPESSSFQTRIGVKRRVERQERVERHELRYKFWESLLALARTRSETHANRRPGKDSWISGGLGRTGFSLTYTIRRFDSQVELWIALGAGQSVKNKSAFSILRDQRERIEADFGADLEWQELPEGDGCRIRYVMPGGYKNPVGEWPQIQSEMVDAMVRLEAAMKPRVLAIP